MTALIDLTGKKFNRLTVIRRAESAKAGIVSWECVCDCGNKTIVRGSNLKNGSVKSCGCLMHIGHNKIHGMSDTTLYRKWLSMLRRCNDPKYQAYKDYGARGIKVCDEWHDFITFKKWVDATRSSEDLTLERIDVNGNYCPENCSWITLSEQASNRRSCVMIEYNGETHNLNDWCEKLGLRYKLIHNRMHKLGWSFEKAIHTPVDVSKRNKVERKNSG